MDTLRKQRFWALALVGLFAVAPLAAKKEKPPVEMVLHPDVEAIRFANEAGMPFEVEGDTVRLNLQGIVIQVRPLTESGRRSFFELRSRLRADPFPTVEQYPEGFVVIELSFMNNSEDEFQFLPGMANLLRGGQKKGNAIDTALGMGELYSFFNAMFESDEMRITMAMEVIYSTTLYLQPGQRSTQLLVFEGLSTRSRKAALRLDFLFVGSETTDLMFPFRVEPVER